LLQVTSLCAAVPHATNSSLLCIAALQREKDEAARERADANARVQALLAELQAERANSSGLEVRFFLSVSCSADLAAIQQPATQP